MKISLCVFLAQHYDSSFTGFYTMKREIYSLGVQRGAFFRQNSCIGIYDSMFFKTFVSVKDKTLEKQCNA